MAGNLQFRVGKAFWKFLDREAQDSITGCGDVNTGVLTHAFCYHEELRG
jgi:hypothetical protein